MIILAGAFATFLGLTFLGLLALPFTALLDKSLGKEKALLLWAVLVLLVTVVGCEPEKPDGRKGKPGTENKVKAERLVKQGDPFQRAAYDHDADRNIFLPYSDTRDLPPVLLDRRGVKVTKGLRSVSNSRVYAIGDVAGGLQFTHVAGYQAGLVVRSALFRLPVTNRTDMIPWVTYIDPEVAHVGLTEADAREAHGDVVETARFDYAENDRARAELKTDGFAKVVVGKRGRILGCSIVGAQAGELIQTWALAISKGMKIGDMAGHVAAYPTLGEVSKRAAGAYFTPRLFESDTVKFIVRLLARLG